MNTYETLLNNDLNWALREGSLHFEGENSIHETLQRIVEQLQEHDIEYAIAGDMAMYYHGYRRFTEGIDILVTAEGLAKIHDKLEGRGYVKPFAKSKNLRDAVTGVKIDFLIAGGFPGDGKPGPIVFPVPVQASMEIQGAKILTLPQLLELKISSGSAPGRMKDLADVQELIRHLNLPQDFAQELDEALREKFSKLWHEVQESPPDF